MAMDRQWLWQELERIGALVIAALPPDDPAHQAFKGIAFDCEDCAEPSDDALHAAWAAFNALPDYQRRRVLNGWSDYTARRGEVQSHPADWHRVLFIQCGGGRVPFACHMLHDGAGAASSAQVAIPQGATQAEALAALGRITDLVKRRWPTLIDHKAVNGMTAHELAGSGEPAAAAIDAAVLPLLKKIMDLVVKAGGTGDPARAQQAKDRRGATSPRRKTAGHGQKKNRPTGPLVFLSHQSKREEKAVSRSGECAVA